MAEPVGYLGLELSGAKNDKTALAAIQYYPKEKKVFLLDIYDRVTSHEDQSSDEALIELIDEMRPGISLLGVNVPLTLPPCFACARKVCSKSGECADPAVKWMRQATRRASSTIGRTTRIRDFTPYTQRPVELYVRYQVLPELEVAARFEVDEALGGNKAPLTARMQYLQRHLAKLGIVEVWPKLTVALLGTELGLQKRVLATYRKLEEGAQARQEILEALSQHGSVFIYDRDLRKLSNSLAAFDAFLCAYTALLSDLGQCVKPPAGFPVDSGWVAQPRRTRR